MKPRIRAGSQRYFKWLRRCNPRKPDNIDIMLSTFYPIPIVNPKTNEVKYT